MKSAPPYLYKSRSISCNTLLCCQASSGVVSLLVNDVTEAVLCVVILLLVVSGRKAMHMQPCCIADERRRLSNIHLFGDACRDAIGVKRSIYKINCDYEAVYGSRHTCQPFRDIL